MSDELEKRLRELYWGATNDEGNWQFRWQDILAAARIGAELEREACAQAIILDRDDPHDKAMDVSFDLWDGMTIAAHIIRERGTR